MEEEEGEERREREERVFFFEQEQRTLTHSRHFQSLYFCVRMPLLPCFW